jgi:[ribosomal protein S5]-alanine N-acetyltransferase
MVAMNYFLTSARLGFRCWRQQDLPLAMDLWGNSEVTALIGGPFSPEAVQMRLAQEIAQMEEHGVQYWPVFLLDGNRHAGCAGLRRYGNEQRVYELGFHLRRDFWGQGLAAEAARTVIDYGFGKLGAQALAAGHHPANEASRHVLIKLGFVFKEMEFYPPSGLMEPVYRLTQMQDQQD